MGLLVFVFAFAKVRAAERHHNPTIYHNQGRGWSRGLENKENKRVVVFGS